MEIISTIIIGFIVGLIARMVKPGNDSMGFIATTLVGIGGAFVGAYLGQALGIYQPDEPAGFLGALVGAVLLLFLLKIIFGKK